MNRIKEKLEIIKNDDLYLDHSRNIPFILGYMKDRGCYEKIKKDFGFGYAKTKFDDADSALFIFVIDIPSSISGSSAQSDEIMKYVTMLEKTLIPIEYIYLTKELENKKIVAYLKIVKKFL